MLLLKSCCVFALFCFGCFAQATQSPATAEELQFFRFMLMNVASVDHDQGAIEAYESSLVRNFGLNTQESAIIHGAAQRLKALLQQVRRESQRILQGKKAFSEDDAAALKGLIDRREELVATLSNEILNAIRPETAARLRAPGHIVAEATKRAQGGR
jgi:hypothetical protein